MAVDLYDHQREAIDKLRSGSILCGGVGSGKSRTSIAYYFEKECCGIYSSPPKMKKPKDLYIITTAMKRDSLDWQGELAFFGLYDGYNACGIRIFIDSWNNIDKYSNVSNAFFIFDEQRVVGKGKWAKSFIKIAKTNRWILLSATPGDTWSDYIPVFVANGFYKNRTEFLHRHAVFSRYAKYPKIEKYVAVDKLEEFRDRVLVEMPMARGTKRLEHLLYSDVDSVAYARALNGRWNDEEGRPILDAAELCRILRKISNCDSSKLKLLDEVVDVKKKVIVFYNFDYELDILRKYCTDRDLLFGEYNGHKHEELPKGDKWAYLVQYSAGAEGWNCVRTDTIIFFSLNYSYKIMEQARGRIDRLNTPYAELHYYYLIANSSIDFAIRNTLKRKEKFNEDAFVNEKII